MTIATDYRECEMCGTRVLLFHARPPLNYWPDQAGNVAVSIDNPRRARFLAHGEEPLPLEKRHSVHECGQVRDPAEPRLDPLCRGGNHAGCIGPPGTTCECRCHDSRTQVTG